MNRFVFGPVPSRRLGRSLGIDLVPFKTCSYDCVYCQLGRTTELTVERRAWRDVAVILQQARELLDREPDYITLAGSGEPTLYQPIGELIAGLKALTAVPIAVLTNGSLLSDPEVRTGLAQADLVIPSLDAGDAETFQRVNRPHPSLAFDIMVAGLVEFRRVFRGEYWLEVFLVEGYNTAPSQLAALRRLIARIAPDRVQVNTATRPPAERDIRAIAPDRLAALASQLGEGTEVIADYRAVHQQPVYRARRQEVLDLLRRRPCTMGDVAVGLGIHRTEAAKHVGELLEAGLAQALGRGGQVYYGAAGGADAA